MTTRPSKRHGCLSERFVLRRLMEHLGSTLRKIARERDFDVTVSKQKLNKVELIELVRRQREDATQDLVYSARPFILCGLPVKRPPADTLIHRRRNGRFFLYIQGHPDFGLPFGQDRLIAIWVASLAVRQKSRVIEFETASKILEEFGMPRNGFHCRRLIDGFKRIFASTIFFGNEGQAPTQELFTCARFCFFDRMRVWYTGENHGQKLRQSVNRIELSEQFWREIQVHPIPAERHAVRGLANSPRLSRFLSVALLAQSYREKDRTGQPVRTSGLGSSTRFRGLWPSAGFPAYHHSVAQGHHALLAGVPGAAFERWSRIAHPIRSSYPQPRLNFRNFSRQSCRARFDAESFIWGLS